MYSAYVAAAPCGVSAGLADQKVCRHAQSILILLFARAAELTFESGIMESTVGFASNCE